MLRFEKVKVEYNGIPALMGVDLHVEAGEIVGLVVANGAGKSTRLKAATGLSPLAAGATTFQGRAISALKAEEIVDLGILQVPEGPHIFPLLTVEENLNIGAFSRRAR